jgi:hypothetical protein
VTGRGERWSGRQMSMGAMTVNDGGKVYSEGVGDGKWF